MKSLGAQIAEIAAKMLATRWSRSNSRKKYLEQGGDKFRTFLNLIKRVYPLTVCQTSPRKKSPQKACASKSKTVEVVAPKLPKLKSFDDSMEDFE